MTTVSVSMRNAQEMSSVPVWIQRSTLTVKAGSSDRPTVKKATQERIATNTMMPDVMYSLALAPIELPARPAIRAPIRGRKTMA